MNPTQGEHNNYNNHNRNNNNSNSNRDFDSGNSADERVVGSVGRQCQNCDEARAVFAVPLEYIVPLLPSVTSVSPRTSSSHLEHFIRRASEPSEISTLLRLPDQPTMHDKLEHKFGDMLKQRSLIVDVLAMFFGIGTWIGINGTFIQLPLLVEAAPEGWSLPSYLSVMVQIGNLGPIAYTLIQKYSKTKKNDATMIYGLLAMGTIAALLTAFFYKATAVVFGERHSVALFALTFFTAITACTSSVLFMPYMGRFKEIYLVTYFIGEGLSGLLPSVVALIQGIGGSSECILTNITETGKEIYTKYTPPPRFGTMEFFIFIFFMMLLSCVGFTLIDRLHLAKRQYAAVRVSNGNSYVYEREHKGPISSAGNEMNSNSVEVRKTKSDLSPEISSVQYVFLLLLIGVVSFFANGIFNSIQSYSCLPYGIQAYHLTATLSVIANPVACFLGVFLPRASLRSILMLSSIASVLTAYAFTTALMSPRPPLHGTTTGAVLVIAVWTMLIGLVSYIKLCITTVMRSQGGKSLVWTGGLTQIGSTIGSLLIFVLINFTNSFQADEGC